MSEEREEIGISREKDVQRENILVAKIIEDIIKGSLGPRGMKKILVDSLGYYILSSDGAKMLESMSLWHPVAKIMINTAAVQKKTMGDGSISAVILTSELLKHAETLLDQKVHPTAIASGYEKASRKGQEILNDIAIGSNISDRRTLKKIAYTSLRSKFDEIDSNVLADLVVDAIKQITTKNKDFDIDQIQIVKEPSGTVTDSELVKGIVIDETITHSDMSKYVKEAKIAVLSCPLEIEKFEHLPSSVKIEILIDSPEQIESFVNEEHQIAKKWVERIRSSGANVVICEKRINDLVQYLLAKQGISAVTLWRFSAKEKYLTKVAKASGASIVDNIHDLSGKDLGFAELVEERKVGDNRFVFIEGCDDPMSVSLMIRGISRELIDDTERTLIGAIHSLSYLFQNSKIVAGGGSVHLELKKRLDAFSLEFNGKEQLAIRAFGDALEGIPKTLIENAGLNLLDTLPLARSMHHNPSNVWKGIDVLQREVTDMMESGVVEPLSLVNQTIKSASETAMMILKTDDMIPKREEEANKIPEDSPGRKLPGFLPTDQIPGFEDWGKDHTVF